MDSQVLTGLHVAISLVGILSGLIVLYGFLTVNRMTGTTLVFLATTAATSVTGFFFHRDHILPSHIVGAISIVLLAVVAVALYGFQLRGSWRTVYVAGAVACLYLNVFVLVAQAFLKVPALHALAPKGSEPPFAIVQGVVLVVFVALGILAGKRFHPSVA